MVRFWRYAFVVAFAGVLVLPPIGSSQGALPSQTGPCTAQAAQSMPEGGNHDHLDIDQHKFACRVALAFFDSMVNEFSAKPEVIMGEMDIESDIMAIAIAFPESGLLLYDVSNPATPQFLSWTRYSKCEDVVVDVDCGAYVDLSEDAQVAFLALQNITGATQDPDPALISPTTPPGVQVFDISDPTMPIPTDYYAEAQDGDGGTHTTVSHIIPPTNPKNPNENPATRAPGEYLFSNQNVNHVDIGVITRPAGVPQVTELTEIPMDEVHDMFVDNDKLNGRTYLYVAPGFASGFYVYDVTNPATPVFKGEWDITPECGEDWYSHTTFTVVRNGQRYVTVDAEVFGDNDTEEGFFGPQDAQDQAEGCGKLVGNGDRPGPLWIVNATNFNRLATAPLGNPEDGEEQGTAAQQIKEKSRKTLVTTWVNPARQEAGNIEFSPHNQQVVGNRIYLSHYHGGVYMLNAARAFSGNYRGSAARPTETAFIVPHNKPTRPIPEFTIVSPVIPFVMEFFSARPTVWDTFFYKGCVLIPDSTGGLYSYSMGGIACGDTNINRPPRDGGGGGGDDDGDDD